MADTTTADDRTTAFEFPQHTLRGAFNAAFFRVMDPYIEHNLRRHKQRIFANLPRQVVEIGSGVGANLRYLTAGSRLVAVEPNRSMHAPRL